MTIKRTREILGDKVAHMTDEEVLEMIKNTKVMVDALFDTAVKEIKAGKRVPKKEES